MKTVGIIAEYNPFHNGHYHQINHLKSQGAEQVVVVMGGEFLQRGMPAFCDKYIRARMALECGADFVFELPTVFATASAETFAMGGVSLLDSLGFVDTLCFGSECGDISVLRQIADVSLSLDASRISGTSSTLIDAYASLPDINTADCLSESDISTRNSLQSLLRQGLSYAQAKAKILTCALADKNAAALSQNNGTTINNLHTGFDTGLEEILTGPNNILSIEYLKAIKRLGSPLIPYTIPRKGAGYHDKTAIRRGKSVHLPAYAEINTDNIPSDKKSDMDNFPSADGIRDAYKTSINAGCQADALDAIDGMIPKRCMELLRHCPDRIMPDTAALSKMLYYRLRLAVSKENLTDYFDVSTELAGRIKHFLPDYTDFESFAMLIKTKQYTYTRVCRCLLHILSDICSDDIARFLPSLPISIRLGTKETSHQNLPLTPYARLLGFRKEKSRLLRDVTDIKIITKTADATKLLTDSAALWLWEKDLFASDLYRQCYILNGKTSLFDEYRSRVIIV